MWIYQYRNSPTLPWNSFYAFPSNIEFFAPDLEILNYFISHSPESFQTTRLLVVRFLMRPGRKDVCLNNEGEEKNENGGREKEEEEEPTIHAKIMLVGDQVKLNTGGRTSIIQTCRTEEERVEALRNHFGITLSEKERLGIRGRVTELGRLAKAGADADDAVRTEIPV